MTARSAQQGLRPSATRATLNVEDSPDGDRTRPRGVPLRAIALGALLIPLNCFWVVRMERVSFGPYPSTVSLFANVVFILFVLVGLNALLRRWAPRLAFSQAELLILYTMQAISTGLAGLDGVSASARSSRYGGLGRDAHQWVGGFPGRLPRLARCPLTGGSVARPLPRPQLVLSACRAQAGPDRSWPGRCS